MGFFAASATGLRVLVGRTAEERHLMAAKKKRSRRRRSSKTPEHPPVEMIAVEKLQLDKENPRLAAIDARTETKILLAMWRQMDVKEVAISIAYNGFYQHEPLFAVKRGSKFVVIEGNRRLAAVMLLRSRELRQEVGANELPPLPSAARRNLDRLPVIISTKKDLWQYVGFKHINGPQSWGSYEKAKYICEVHNEYGVSLDDLALRVGDTHSTVSRLYKGYMILEQARERGLFSIENRFKTHFSFSHLYTGLRYPGISAFIGISPNSLAKPNPVPRSKHKQLSEFLLWLYGSKEDDIAPLIKSQNPDLKRLDQVLLSKKGVAALRQGLGLDVGENFSKGEGVVLLEALTAAQSNMQTARGVIFTGFSGESDLYHMAEVILQLTQSVLEDMDDIRVKKRRRKRKSSKKKKSQRRSRGS